MKGTSAAGESPAAVGTAGKPHRPQRFKFSNAVVQLYSSDDVSPSHLPVERKNLVCVLGVPNRMTYADFGQFCGPFIQHMLEMRIVRNDDVDGRYSVLIRFDSQCSTDAFYEHFNGKVFSSLEADACHVLFTVDLQYTGSMEHVNASSASSTKQPTCAVCLEKLDQDSGSILTNICNQSIHCSCISNWTHSGCPVCCYCQQQPEKSICIVCQTSDDLWICVICGFVGCGRYKEGHAIRHWKETQHRYSLEVETEGVWDYIGDNYAYRLIQSKTDGNLVELNHHCAHVGDDCSSCNCCTDPAFREALTNSEVENIVNEYEELLMKQLENQKMYFESLLREVEEETDRDGTEAVEKAIRGNPKVLKVQSKLHKCVKEKNLLDEFNKHLLKNINIWEEKIVECEEREKRASILKNEKIKKLKEQLEKLMLSLDAGSTN